MAALQRPEPELQPSSQQVHLAVSCFRQATRANKIAATGQAPRLLALQLTSPQDAAEDTKGPGCLVAVQSEDTAFLIQCGNNEDDSRPVACLSSSPRAWLRGYDHLAQYVDLQTIPLPSTSKGAPYTLVDDQHAAGSTSTTTSAVTDSAPAQTQQPARPAKDGLPRHDSVNHVLHQVASTDETTVSLAHLDPNAAKATSRMRPTAGEQPKTQLQSRAPHALQVRVRPGAPAGGNETIETTATEKSAQPGVASETIRYNIITLNTDQTSARCASPAGVLGPFGMQVVDGTAPGSQGGAVAPALDLTAPSPTLHAAHAAPPLPASSIRVVSVDQAQPTSNNNTPQPYNPSPPEVPTSQGPPRAGTPPVSGGGAPKQSLQLVVGAAGHENITTHGPPKGMGLVETTHVQTAPVVEYQPSEAGGVRSIQADLVLQPGRNRAAADQLPGGRGSASEGFPRKLVHRYNPNAPRDRPLQYLEPRASTGTATGSEGAPPARSAQGASSGGETNFYLSKGRPGSRAMRPQKYTGVYRQAGRFRAQFSHGGLVHQLGMYDNEESAAQAWDRVAWVYRGRQADLNFPDKVKEYDAEDSKKKVHELMDERMALKKPRGKAAMAAAAAAAANSGQQQPTRSTRTRRTVVHADSDSTATLSDSDNDNEAHGSQDEAAESEHMASPEEEAEVSPPARTERATRSRSSIPAKRRISGGSADEPVPSTGAVLPPRAAAISAYTRYLAGLPASGSQQPGMPRKRNGDGNTTPRTRGGTKIPRRAVRDAGWDMEESEGDGDVGGGRRLVAKGSVTAAGVLKTEDATATEPAGPVRTKPAMGASRASSRDHTFIGRGPRRARMHGCSQERIEALLEQAAELMADEEQAVAEPDGDGWNEQAAVHFLCAQQAGAHGHQWQNHAPPPMHFAAQTVAHQDESMLQVGMVVQKEEEEEKVPQQAPAMEMQPAMMMHQGNMVPGQPPMMWPHAHGMYAGMYPGMVARAYMPAPYGSTSIMPGMMPPGMMPIMAHRRPKKSKHAGIRAYHLMPGSMPSMPTMSLPPPGASMAYAPGPYPAATHAGANPAAHAMYGPAPHMYQMAMMPGYGAYYPQPMYGAGMMGAMQQDGEEDGGDEQEEGQARRAARKARASNDLDSRKSRRRDKSGGGSEMDHRV